MMCTTGSTSNQMGYPTKYVRKKYAKVPYIFEIWKFLSPKSSLAHSKNIGNFRIFFSHKLDWIPLSIRCQSCSIHLNLNFGSVEKLIWSLDESGDQRQKKLFQRGFCGTLDLTKIFKFPTKSSLKKFFLSLIHRLI